MEFMNYGFSMFFIEHAPRLVKYQLLLVKRQNCLEKHRISLVNINTNL